MRRVNLATVLVLLGGLVGAGVSYAATSEFKDVPRDHVFYEDVKWLAETGVTRGCNPPVNDRFCPDDPLTRAQAAALFRRLTVNVVANEGRPGEPGPPGEQGPPGEPGLPGAVDVVSASLGSPVVIEHIGGPINDRNTDLDVGLTLEPGTYLVTVSGAFISEVEYSGSATVWPQLSLWLDRNGDGTFQWQEGEGDISPNAVMPAQADRHISVSGSSVITLDAPTYVGLLGFGYDSEQGSARSGEILIQDATLVAVPLG